MSSVESEWGEWCRKSGYRKLRVGQKSVQAERQVMHERLSTTGKDYLRLLVSEIRVTGKQAEISGSYAAFMSAMVETKAETVVPTFVPNWLPDLDSNQGPAD